MGSKSFAIRLVLTIAVVLANGCQKNDVVAQDPSDSVAVTTTQALSDAAGTDITSDVGGDSNAAVDEAEPEPAVADQPTEPQETAKTDENDGCPDIHAHAPLCEKQLKVLSEIIQDPEPEVLYAVHAETIGRHYLVSDEKHPELFKESIENKGNTYIGVGFEQGYLYIGWQRPSLAFFIDYDPWVVLNHRVVVEVMKKCDNAQCLYEHFSKPDIGDAFLETPQAEQAGFTTKEAKHRIQRLRYAVTQALAKLRESELPTMMNTPEIYQYIRDMILGGRLRVLQANLLETGGIQSIAKAMEQLGIGVQALYLSNAEQYWNYTEAFKVNMLALPFTEDGIVMRTRATYPRNSDYRYSIQPASIFKQWMAHPKTRAVKPMTKHVSVRPDTFPFVVDDLLPE